VWICELHEELNANNDKQIRQLSGLAYISTCRSTTLSHVARDEPGAATRQGPVCHMWLYETCVTKIVHVLALGLTPATKSTKKREDLLYPPRSNILPTFIALRQPTPDIRYGLFTPPTRTKQNCLVLSAVVFTPPTPQDKTVLSPKLCSHSQRGLIETGSRQNCLVSSRRRCEQAITKHMRRQTQKQ